MSTEVREILERIRQLPERDRLELWSQWAQQEDSEWKRLALEAREMARKRGIDDDSIARAVESFRYGGGEPAPNRSQ